jgi:Mn2+/Fe2+ NRAMP family transporter
MVVLGSLRSVMGSLVLPHWLRLLGWLTAILMAAGTIAMVLA